MTRKIDNTNPLAYGMPETADVFFDNNPVFRLPADAKANGENPVAWFSGKETLDSGWALGQQLLDGATAVVEAKQGEGKVLRHGPGSNLPRRARRHFQAAIQRPVLRRGQTRDAALRRGIS